jgi:hypothetical protein
VPDETHIPGTFSITRDARPSLMAGASRAA